MTDETTTEQLAEIEGQAEPIQVREGRWRTRGGDIRNVTLTPAHDSRAKRWPWRDAAHDQTWTPNGQNQFNCEDSPSDLVEYLGPIEPDKTQELPTKTQELETKTQELPTEYAPPEGWRVLAVGERLQFGDMTVRKDGYCYSTERVGYFVGANQRYIRRIEAQPEPVQVREGQWRTRCGTVRNVTPTPECDNRHGRFPWRDTAYDQTWTVDGRCKFNGEDSPLDLIRYLGPIEEQLQPEPQAAAIEELRSEVSYVQRLLGESRQRVTQLEELVGSLRTINEAQEKAFEAAGKENFALKNQLAAVKAELANVAADRQRLRVELDAAQQVPVDSPELRQLRADLEQMTLGRDTYRDGYERVLSDLKTIRETAKAEAVEAIAEWLEPIRLVDSAYVANATMQHLPQIMRHLTGLDSHAID